MNYSKCGQKLAFPLTIILSDSLYENFAFTPDAVHTNHNNYSPIHLRLLALNVSITWITYLA